MDNALVWYGILGVLALVAAVGVRYAIYMALVKFNRWLPEQATRVANISSISIGGLALAAIVGRALLQGH